MTNDLRKYLKAFVNFIFLLFSSFIYIIFRAISLFHKKGDKVFWSFSQFLSLFPGSTGSFIRKNFFYLVINNCSRSCAIMFGTIFSQLDTEIGKDVYIGPNCNIGSCKIENNCILGSNVHIMSGNKQHKFDDLTRSIREQGGIFEKITIGEDTWIGNCSVVMANIGKKCIVGAGSVVTKDVEDYSIIAGNPARLIRKRNQHNDQKDSEPGLP